MEIIFIATLMETALVAILLASFFIIRYFLKRQKDNRGVHKSKTFQITNTEKAVILSIEQVPLLNDQLQIKILVKVIPQNGRNFVIELKERLSSSELTELRTGNTVSVHYDGMNTKNVYLLRSTCV